MSTIESIRTKYNDIIEQNSGISSHIAQNIQMSDLGEETGDMITSAMLEIEDEARKRTIGERMVNLLPARIAKHINSGVATVERAKMKNSNIATVATKHFDMLSERRDSVKSNIMNLYDIHAKLTQSRELLEGLSGELSDGLSELSDNETITAKKDILVGKELSVQVASQIAVQNDLINQLDMVDFTANIVLDTINQTLPDIKANFIDQISISTALENLKNFKDSVDNTRQMTLSLQEETFKNTEHIMLAIAEQGVGLQEADILRMEKLNEAKAKLGKTVSTRLIENSKKLDSNLQRIQNMNANNQNSFDRVQISELTTGVAAPAADPKQNSKDGEIDYD